RAAARAAIPRRSRSASARANARARGTPATRGTSATFCRAVSCGTSSARWKTKPMRTRRTRRRSASASAARSRPSKSTRPRSGARRLPSMARSVVLPEPDGPVTTTVSPGATARLASRTARTAPGVPGCHVFETRSARSTSVTPAFLAATPAPRRRGARGPLRGRRLRLPEAEDLPEDPRRPRDDSELAAEVADLAERRERLGAMPRVARVRLGHDGPRDAVRADDLRRRPHHELRHLPEDQRRAERKHRARDDAERGHPLPEVVPREAEVPRLFGDVDLHDPLQHGRQWAAAAQRRTLDVVDRVLAAEDEDEEERREARRVPDDALREEALAPGEARDVQARPVHELLEHERMVRFLDRLVIEVAELRGAVRQRGRVREEPALEHALELDADLHEGRGHVEADAGPDGRGLRLVPRGAAELVADDRLPTGIVRVDPVLGVVPRDVRVRVEVLHDGLMAQASEELLVALGDRKSVV